MFLRLASARYHFLFINNATNVASDTMSAIVAITMYSIGMEESGWVCCKGVTVGIDDGVEAGVGVVVGVGV